MSRKDVTETTRVEARMREAVGKGDAFGPLFCDEAASVIYELDRLRARVAELEGARAKAGEGAAPSFAQAEVEIENIASMVNVPRELLPPGSFEIVPFTAIDIAEELQRRAHVIATQSTELERLRKFAVQVGDAALASGDEIRVRLTSALVNLDRASHAQSDPQPGATPCAK